MAAQVSDRRRTIDRTTEFNGLIGEGSQFEGILKGDGNYRIVGRFVGDCLLEGVIVIEPEGEWLGNIVAESVIIDGHVKGDVTANHIELGESGRVAGELAGRDIAIARGAIHEGRMRMDGSGAVTRFDEKRSRSD